MFRYDEFIENIVLNVYRLEGYQSAPDLGNIGTIQEGRLTAAAESIARIVEHSRHVRENRK